MKIIEEGNYVKPNWSLKVQCSGEGGWANDKLRPCYSKLELNSSDIFKRYSDDEAYFGFFCPKCHCFTEIDEKDIPDDIKKFCLTIASPNSDYFKRLSDEEKAKSEEIFNY